MNRRGVLTGTVATALVIAMPAIVPRTRHVIMTNLFMVWREQSARIVHDDHITHVYKFMVRFPDGENIFQTENMEFATVGTPEYARWLREDGPFDIAPHLGFGGGVSPVPGGDPTFYGRWQAFARTLS